MFKYQRPTPGDGISSKNSRHGNRSGLIALVVTGFLLSVGFVLVGNANAAPSDAPSGAPSSAPSSSPSSTPPVFNPTGGFSAATVCVKAPPALMHVTFSGSGFDPTAQDVLQIEGRSQNQGSLTIGSDGSASASIDVPYAGTPASSLSLEIVVATDGSLVYGPVNTTVTVTNCGPVVKDVCKNLDGVQKTVPKGYVLKDGKCVKKVKPTTPVTPTTTPTTPVYTPPPVQLTPPSAPAHTGQSNPLTLELILLAIGTFGLTFRRRIVALAAPVRRHFFGRRG